MDAQLLIVNAYAPRVTAGRTTFCFYASIYDAIELSTSADVREPNYPTENTELKLKDCMLVAKY